ncbi:MAG: hypothetical protein AAF668_02875 [Pseudomonadota bacterium]
MITRVSLWKTLCCCSILIVAGCVSSPRSVLESRFEAIGIPPATAECMANDLSDNLSRQDLNDLAEYTSRISRASSAPLALAQLVKIDNPRAVSGIATSAASCFVSQFDGGSLL